jgi:hypothetical protein
MLMSNNETPHRARHAAVFAFIEAKPGIKIFKLVIFKDQPTRTIVPTDVASRATPTANIFNLGTGATLRAEFSMEACL